MVTPPDTVVEAGNTLYLVCVGLGSPQPTVSWEREGEPLDQFNNSNVFIYEEVSVMQGLLFVQSILEVCSVPEDATGYFNCSVENAFSFDFSTFLVTVEPTRSECVCVGLGYYWNPIQFLCLFS